MYKIYPLWTLKNATTITEIVLSSLILLTILIFSNGLYRVIGMSKSCGIRIMKILIMTDKRVNGLLWLLK